MSVKQNAMDFATKYPLAAEAVDESIYVDDCLTGADTLEGAVDVLFPGHQILPKFLMSLGGQKYCCRICGSRESPGMMM